MIEIKRTRDADLLAQLNEPVQRFHAQTYPVIFKPFDWQKIQDVFSEQVDQDSWFFYVAWEKDQALGYIALTLQHKAENPFQFEQHVLYIDQIGVMEAHRRKGIGNLLLEKAHQVAHEKQISRIELDFWFDNKTAGTFFQKAGFLPFRSQYYRHLP